MSVYTFGGWYLNANLSGGPWDFENNTIHEDTMLYAKWDKKEFTVTFDSIKGSVVENQTIFYGGLLTEPTEPTRAGYTFEGWYRDNDMFNNKWNFNEDTVTGNMTLYA